MPAHTPDLGLSFDPVEARQLLARAGFPGGRGFPKVNLLWPEVIGIHGGARWLCDQWRFHLGVNVHRRTISLEEYLDRDPEEDPALRFIGWIADYPDPDNLLRVPWKDLLPTGKNAEYWRLVERARRLTEQQRRLDLYRQAELILIQGAYLIPLEHLGELLLVKPWVTYPRHAANGRVKWQDVIIEPH